MSDSSLARVVDWKQRRSVIWIKGMSQPASEPLPNEI
jgi:hypothetical protein